MSPTHSISLDPLLPLFADWCGWDPRLANLLTDLQADFTVRLKTRGPKFFTIDLPQLDKVYCKGLSSGYLAWDKLPTGVGSPRSGSPVSRLLLRQFASSGQCLDPCPNTVFFTRTLFCLWKKARKEFSEEDLEPFYSQFFRTDSDLRPPNMTWGKEALNIQGLRRSREEFRINMSDTSYGRKLFRYICFVADRIVSDLPEVSLLPKGTHGPGAVAEGGRYRDKYAFPSWGRKLSKFFPPDAFCVHDFSVPDFSIRQEPRISRLAAVPKTWKGPRLITIEPQAYVFGQKALMQFLRDNLPGAIRATYAFSSQDPSRELCRKASTTGELATVDLSEASDRLSLWLLEVLFSANFSLLEGLNACRMHCVENPITGKPFQLRKFAGMGNATTFPVQSIVYSILCIAAVMFHRGQAMNRRSLLRAAYDVQVFGDDLIVPSDVVPALDFALQASLLKVNLDKTHYEGHFRESCGMDAWYGTDVTPLYMWDTYLHIDRIERNPEVLVSWIEVSNNAYKKGLWYTSYWMNSKVPKRLRKLIPISEDDGYGLRFHSHQSTDGAPRGVSRKYSDTLQRDTFRALRLSMCAERVERSSYLNLLQYFTEVPEMDEVNPLSEPLKWQAGWTRRSGISLRTGWV